MRHQDVRSFGSKDRKTVSQKYAAIHDEAERHFAKLKKARSNNADVVLRELLRATERAHTGNLNRWVQA
jgi:hypothetical protein